MKKKGGIIIFTTIFLVGWLIVTANAQELNRETLKAEIKKELKEEMQAEGGILSKIQEHIQIGGLIEVGAAWQDVEYQDGSSKDDSDLCLTTVELGIEAEVNEWVNAGVLLLYEDPTSFAGDDDETSVDLDEATVTIGNTEAYPLYCSAGKMYIPFGALLTHFPDDPLIDQPLTLVLGETSEKAVLLGVEHEGLAVSGYLFNGDVDEYGEDNHIESYGFDANYSFDDEEGFDLLVGVSYLSNLGDSDGFTDAIDGAQDALATEIAESEGLTEDDIDLGLKDYVAGFDAYAHVGYAGFFLDVEYMTALDELELGGQYASEDEVIEVSTNTKLEPEVWNVEFGYNWDWGKNLEIALKYATSDEAGALLGFPEDRYGIALNQEIFEGVIVSLAYLNDDFEDDDIDGRDDRDVVYSQVAIEF
jgi:hypothetical protein